MVMLYRIAYFILSLYWAIWNPVTVGVNILLIRNEKILLVKKTYVDGWHLPGGGAKRRETLEECAKRESYEEIGYHIDHLDLLGVYTTFREKKSDHVAVFISHNFTMENKTSPEILDKAFFDLSELPDKLSTGALTSINRYVNNPEKAGQIWVNR